MNLLNKQMGKMKNILDLNHMPLDFWSSTTLSRHPRGIDVFPLSLGIYIYMINKGMYIANYCASVHDHISVVWITRSCHLSAQWKH